MPNHYSLEGLSVPIGLIIVQPNCFIEEGNDGHDNESEMRIVSDDQMDSMYLNMVANKKKSTVGNKTRKKELPSKKKRTRK
jgi:hypothetical protein